MGTNVRYQYVSWVRHPKMEELLTELDWTGFYLEGVGNRGWMNMRLQFQSGALRGEGVDRVGTWHLHGVYSAEDLECSWTKHYLGKHDVEYAGKISEMGIQGYWSIHGIHGDRFHIWPVSMTHIQQAYLADEDR